MLIYPSPLTSIRVRNTCGALRIEDIMCHMVNVGSRYFMNLLKQFLERINAVEEHQTLGNVEHDGAAAVLRQGYLSDDLLLGVGQGSCAHAFLFELVEHLPDELLALLQILFIGAEVNGENTGVGKRTIVRIDVIGDTMLLANAHAQSVVHGRSANDVVEQR